MKKFNINYYVYFKTSEYGKQLYRDKMKKISESFDTEMELDSNGFCKMQMHNFMYYFGGIYDFESPVEKCNIYFEEKDLHDEEI